MDIPLIRLQDVEDYLEGSGENKRWADNQVSVDSAIPDTCFAIFSQDLDKNFPLYGQGVPVFARQFESLDAVEQIFLLRFHQEAPRLCRMIRSEQKAGAGEVFRASRRKSFMTPTPLHIPTSRISPIPDYTHSFFYLKLFDQENLEVVSTDQSERLLPLVKVLPD